MWPTSVAHQSNRGRGVNQYPLFEQGQFPKDEDVSPKELEKSTDGTRRMYRLKREGEREAGMRRVYCYKDTLQ